MASMKEIHQYTVGKAVRIAGVGLHSGKPVRLSIKPASIDSGISFVRTDLGQGTVIPAFMNRVIDTRLATTIGQGKAFVSTTEHLLAAFMGLGIDNAIIEIDGPEVPIMDGSAAPFVQLLSRVRRHRQNACRRAVKITREIVYADGQRTIMVTPYDGLKITCEIDFPHHAIQHQAFSLTITPDKFSEEIARARTFGFLQDVERLWKDGLALGGSLENAIVIDDAGVLNEEGLRYADEFVRHKMLDMIGDIALLGSPLLGHVTASKTGHSQHIGLLRAIASSPESWEFVRFGRQGERRIRANGAALACRLIPPFLIPSPAALPGEPLAA